MGWKLLQFSVASQYEISRPVMPYALLKHYLQMLTLIEYSLMLLVKPTRV